MVYMGAKTKYADEIVPILQKIIDEHNTVKCYVEPFVGGANIIDKIKCRWSYGTDKNKTLIDLHCQLQRHPEQIPEHITREDWDKAKEIYRKYKGDVPFDAEMAPWFIGAIQFFGSNNRGGFSRGYAKPANGRDYYNEGYRNAMKQRESWLYKGVCFSCCDYTFWDFSKETKESQGIAVVYCDPPYEGTKPYGYAFETGFDYEQYWNWVREQSKYQYVVCSEQNFPDDFIIIWEKDVTRTVNKGNDFKATEKLGVWKYGLLGLEV